MRKLVWLLAAVACVLSLDLAAQNIQLVMQAQSVDAGKSNTTKLLCPSGYVPVGFSVNPAVKDRVSYFGHYMIDKNGNRVDPTTLTDGSSMSGGGFGGTPSAPSYLGNLTVSMTLAVPGWETTAVNTSTVTQLLTHLIVCQMMPPMARWFVYSQTLPSDREFDFFLPVPAGYDLVGLGFDGFPNTRPLPSLKTWQSDWSVPAEDFAANRLPVGVYMPDKSTVWEAIMRLEKNVPPNAKAGNTVVGAVLAVPTTTPPAPTNATVVEFYNQALDHYFITAAPAEISDLDNGVHKGWTRTGQSFHTYAAGSTGPTTRQPVCRAYGNPDVGLDSHFYSASMSECFDTLGKFAGAWLLEASEVFQMDLPDATTGACPAGDIPVYRTFNNRADANHRYTTSTAIRDQMVARGYIAEGYGPNNVTLCALP